METRANQTESILITGATGTTGGAFAGTTGDVQRVLGRPPITFDQFLARNAALLQ